MLQQSALSQETVGYTRLSKFDDHFFFQFSLPSCAVAAIGQNALDHGTGVCIGFMGLITQESRSQDLSSLSVRRLHVAFSTTGFNNGGKPRPERGETAALRRGIQKAWRT